FQREMKIVDPRHSLSLRELIAPVVESLRLVAGFDCPRGSGRNVRTPRSLRPSNDNLQWRPVQSDLQPVVNRLLRREWQLDPYVLVLPGQILKCIGPPKGHFVRAEPQQSLLPVIELKICVHLARIHWDVVRDTERLYFLDSLAFFLHLNRLR